MDWNPKLEIVDCHAEGEIERVVVGGVGEVTGETRFEKKIWLEHNRDEIRQFLLFESRGAVWHNANIVFESSDPRAQTGYVILESTEYPAMSGSNTICVATVLLERGMVPIQDPFTDLTLESAAGLITVRCACEAGKVTSVRFVNQPAFVYHRDAIIEVEGYGSKRIDVAWGGMTYAMAEARDFDVDIEPSAAREICDLGETIKAAAVEQLPVSYPGNPQMPGITNFELMGPADRQDGIVTATNTVVVSPGRCDRSPCGTGTSARMALMHARGELAVGETFVHRSITGSTFTCTAQSQAAPSPARSRDCPRSGPTRPSFPPSRVERGSTGTRRQCSNRPIPTPPVTHSPTHGSTPRTSEFGRSNDTLITNSEALNTTTAGPELVFVSSGPAVVGIGADRPRHRRIRTAPLRRISSARGLRCG